MTRLFFVINKKLTILQGGHQVAVKYNTDLSFIDVNFSIADLSDRFKTDMYRMDDNDRNGVLLRILNKADRIIIVIFGML